MVSRAVGLWGIESIWLPSECYWYYEEYRTSSYRTVLKYPFVPDGFNHDGRFPSPSVLSSLGFFLPDPSCPLWAVSFLIRPVPLRDLVPQDEWSSSWYSLSQFSTDGCSKDSRSIGSICLSCSGLPYSGVLYPVLTLCVVRGSGTLYLSWRSCWYRKSYFLFGSFLSGYFLSNPAPLK
jgi:hypothetical protein